MASYLFVPGGQRTAADFDQLRALLEAQGHPTRALTLSDPARASLADHLGQVTAALAGSPPEGLILAGHSYGGFVSVGAAAQAPQHLAELAMVDAPLPHGGQSLWGVFRAAGLDAAAFGVPPWPLFTTPLAFDQGVLDRLPKSYIRCRHSEFQELTRGLPAWIASRPLSHAWRCQELDTGHYPMLENPGELARLLQPR
ncbi:MAG: alpha/beta hydrolase [Deltaproteobacteria bacterium]|nr:alpha/beta hydrolase [Deltaproteobacteria bacterium]